MATKCKKGLRKTICAFSSQEAIIPKNEAHRNAAAVGGREADEGGTGGLVILGGACPDWRFHSSIAAARLVLQRYML